MIDEREALRTLEAWFDKYSYLSEKSDYHFRLLSRVRNAILALGDYVKRTNALQIDNVRLQMEAELNEDWGGFWEYKYPNYVKRPFLIWTAAR
jgi:hypothetical protein